MVINTIILAEFAFKKAYANPFLFFTVAIGMYAFMMYLAFISYPFKPKNAKNLRKSSFIYLTILAILLYCILGSKVFSSHLVPSISKSELLQKSANKFIDDISEVAPKFLKSAFPSDTIPVIASIPNVFPSVRTPFVFIQARPGDSPKNAFMVNINSTYSGYVARYFTLAEINADGTGKGFTYHCYYSDFNWHALRAYSWQDSKLK